MEMVSSLLIVEIHLLVLEIILLDVFRMAARMDMNVLMTGKVSVYHHIATAMKSQGNGSAQMIVMGVAVLKWTYRMNAGSSLLVLIVHILDASGSLLA
jgi:hypothetical protein